MPAMPEGTAVQAVSEEIGKQSQRCHQGSKKNTGADLEKLEREMY